MKKFKFIILVLLVALLAASLIACTPAEPTPENKDIEVNIVAAGFYTELCKYYIEDKNDSPYNERTIASFSDTIENQVVAHVEFTNVNRNFSTLQYKVIINDSIQSIYYAAKYTPIIEPSGCERYLNINIFEDELWKSEKKWSIDKVKSTYFNQCKLTKGENHTCVPVINLPYKDPVKQVQYSPKNDKIVFVVQEVDLVTEVTTVLAQCEIK